MITRLEEIKKLHEEAVKSSQIAFDTGSCAEEDKVKDILGDLFQKEHTDWLIEQAEKLEKIREEADEIYNRAQTDSNGEVDMESEDALDFMYQLITRN